MPIDWAIYGAWAGYVLLTQYARQKQEEERRRDLVVGAYWTNSDYFGGSPTEVGAHFTRLLEKEFEWHYRAETDSVIEFRRGDFSLTSVPAQRDMTWDDVPINLTISVSRAGPSATKIAVKFAAPPIVEFTREAASWFYETASKEWAGILERGRQHCPVWTNVGWNGQLDCPQSWSDLRATTRQILTNGLRWNFHKSEDGRDVFRRGSVSAFCASSNGRAKWIELPSSIRLSLVRDGATQRLFVEFVADEEVLFDKSLADFFHKSAERELSATLERLNEHYQSSRWQQETETEAEHEGDESDSDEGANDPDTDDDDDLDAELLAALTTLGLTDSATWRQVQAAYRRLAKKYHPDTHSSRRLSPQEKKQLERQFSAATAAYDRLRDFFED